MYVVHHGIFGKGFSFKGGVGFQGMAVWNLQEPTYACTSDSIFLNHMEALILRSVAFTC